MTKLGIYRQLIQLSTTRLDQIFEQCCWNLIFYLFKVPPALDIWQESSGKELVWAENFKEVTLFAIQSDHSESQSASFRIND